MGSIADKLQNIIKAKNDIKAALLRKGKTPSETISTYATLINELPVAGVDVKALSDFIYNPTGTILTSTDGQSAITELGKLVPIICALELDSTGTRLIISVSRATLRDNLTLIVRTHLTLTGNAVVVFNGNAKPLINKDGSSTLSITKNASFIITYNNDTGYWYVL